MKWNWYIGNKDTEIKAIGKDGKNGINGKDGLSAYELWKQSVADGNINWPKNQTTMEHFFLYLKGKDGENGITPHVGENGNWYIGNHDTNFPAQGQKGENGKDGASPYIGPNGNWWINTSDTKIKAQGEKGVNGASAYELWVNDVKNDKIKDKNNSAWAKDKITMADFYTYLSGTNGNNGKSTYELWKETVGTGNINDPKNPGQK